MSRTTIHRIAANGDVSHFADARNSWGFAPAIWDHFGLKFFGSTPRGAERLADLRKIWDLFGTRKLDALDSILLGATFDRVWVRRDRFSLLVAALDRFTREHARPNGISETCAEVARALERLETERPFVLGAAIDATSTICSWWERPGEDEPTAPFNILRDKLASDGNPHWEIGENPG